MTSKGVLAAILVAVSGICLFGGCDARGPEKPGTGEAAANAGPASPHNPHAGRPPTNGAPKPATMAGKVLETMSAGSYTYVRVSTGGETAWWAGPKFQVKVGETVRVPTDAMPMRGFESKTLNRTFDLVYFANLITKVDDDDEVAAALEKAHAQARTPAANSKMDFSGVAKADGGLTVAEIFEAGESSAGKEVVVRGKVVKYNANILDKNWIHLRDGTGAEGTNDITVTTDDIAKLGDTVLVRGKLAANRDLGYGYKFALMIENAKVTIE